MNCHFLRSNHLLAELPFHYAFNNACVPTQVLLVCQSNKLNGRPSDLFWQRLLCMYMDGAVVTFVSNSHGCINMIGEITPYSAETDQC